MVCVRAARAPWNAVWQPNTRVGCDLGVARRIPGTGRVGVGGGEEEEDDELGGGDVNMHTVQTAGGETVHGWWQRRARWLKC